MNKKFEMLYQTAVARDDKESDLLPQKVATGFSTMMMSSGGFKKEY